MGHSRNEVFNYLNYDKPKNSLTRLIDSINETYKARGTHLFVRCLLFSPLSQSPSVYRQLPTLLDPSDDVLRRSEMMMHTYGLRVPDA